MTKYFKTSVRFAFLKYYLLFNKISRFTEHTGFSCTKRYLKRMKRQYSKLLELHSVAKKNFDFENLAFIEMGKEKLP